MRIHKEGYLIILIAVVALGILIPVIDLISMPSWLQYLLWALLLITFIFIVRFFRSPKRSVQIDESNIICPADGKIVAIEEVVEDEYLKEKMIQVSVFMSPNNVHVNWAPVSGYILYMKYHPGKFLVAWHPKSSTENERTTIVIRNSKGNLLLMRQIAGAMARRIVCYAREGADIRQGDEFGFIKFGSRVDLFLPLNCNIKVELNQKVEGRKTIIATF